MRVSAIITAYNGSRWLERCIESVLAQTHTDLEVIVVDDGSTDDSAAIAARYPVRLIKQQNQKVAAARNTGIAAATGEALALLDQDDEWYPSKIETQLLRLRGDVALVGSLLHYADLDGRILGTAGERADDRQDDIRGCTFMPNAPSSLLFHTEHARAIGGFDVELARRAPVDDLDFVARMLADGTMTTVMEPLGMYRIHAQAASATQFRQMQDATRFLQARHRSAGLTWEQWESTYKPKLDLRRQDWSKFLYRSAGLKVASGRRVRGAGTLALAGILGPNYVVSRLKRQRRR